MKMEAGFASEVLDKYISGYHEYALDQPVHISHVSKNLCDMLGMTEKELLSPAADMLLPSVHPADSSRYQAFLTRMAGKEQTGSLEYRIITKTGEMRYVAVSMTSVKREDGKMAGYAVLAEITAGRDEMENLRFINDTVPCGLLRYSCEKVPKITFVNETMLELMRIPQKNSEALDPVELYKSNIYLMIAEENRGRFAQVLQEVFLQGKPHAGEVSVIRGDGSRGRLFGWVTKCLGQDGQEEFQSICMDVTHRYQAKQHEQTKSYLDALSYAYDMIFEFDKAERTVSYLQGNVPFFDEFLKGVPMDFGIAIEKWLNTVVKEEDRTSLRSFLLSYVLRGRKIGEGPPRITFGLKEKEGFQTYQGVLLKTNHTKLWLCCSVVSGSRRTGPESERGLLTTVPVKEKGGPHVKIRTFGYFDVFVDGQPIMFRYEKAKELLALLVDRQGGYVSSEEAISFLWEDEPASPVVLARYRKVSLRLKNLLEEYGISQIMESINGKRRIVTEQVECDLYQYLSQRAEYADLFNGSYLTNYSWGEVTHGELLARYYAQTEEKGESE